MATTNENIGNLIPAPGYSYIDEIKLTEILYSTVGLTQKGMTLKPGNGVILAGTVMGRITSSKLWAPYVDANSDGTQVARGVIRDTVDTGASATSPVFMGNIVIAGILRNSKIVGSDAAALTDLNARVDTVLDIYQF